MIVHGFFWFTNTLRIYGESKAQIDKYAQSWCFNVKPGNPMQVLLAIFGCFCSDMMCFYCFLCKFGKMFTIQIAFLSSACCILRSSRKSVMGLYWQYMNLVISSMNPIAICSIQFYKSTIMVLTGWQSSNVWINSRIPTISVATHPKTRKKKCIFVYHKGSNKIIKPCHEWYIGCTAGDSKEDHVNMQQLSSIRHNNWWLNEALDPEMNYYLKVITENENDNDYKDIKNNDSNSNNNINRNKNKKSNNKIRKVWVLAKVVIIRAVHSMMIQDQE